jgi:hypothetical protein
LSEISCTFPIFPKLFLQHIYLRHSDLGPALKKSEKKVKKSFEEPLHIIGNSAIIRLLRGWTSKPPRLSEPKQN